jgi:hypothetical protein
MWLSVLSSSRGLLCSVIASTCLLMMPQLSALIFLDDVMTPSVQKKTGVDGLSYRQRLALEQWLNENFVMKNQAEEKKISKGIYLSQNIDNGRQLELSDGSLWEVSPDDTTKASSWILPFPLKIEPNDDPVDKDQYPSKILNQNTGFSVKVKMVRAPNPEQVESSMQLQ